MGFFNPSGSGSVTPLPGDLVLRDSNGNAFANAFLNNATSAAGAGTTTTLVASDSRQQTITGTLGQTFKLPDATTLTNGDAFYFNNNGSAGTLTVQNTGAGAITTVPISGYCKVTLISNASANGTWDNHVWAPSNATWGSTGLNISGSFVVSTNSTTALTIDTSQNATFAGTNINMTSTSAQIRLNSGSSNDAQINYINASNALQLRIGRDGAGSDLFVSNSANVMARVKRIGTNGSSQILLSEGVATPSGGTAGLGYAFGTTSNFGIFFGTGAPTLAAAQGSLYLNAAGSGVADRLYVNTNGSTGWTNFTSAA